MLTGKRPFLRFTLCLSVAALSIDGGTLRARAATPAAKPAAAAVRAHAAILIDAETGETLYADQADGTRFPASITKIMTLYLTFEALSSGKLRLDDRVTMSANAAARPASKLWLKPGESLSVDQAIRAVAVKSANDVATALAERVGGDEAAFVRRMNARAKTLGMVNTHYANPTGLPNARQLSSARDIARLSAAMIREHGRYYHYLSTPSFSYRGQVSSNHNHLLKSMPQMDGLKTGFIRDSGFNLSASVVRDQRRLIAVVLGAPSAATRDAEVRDLLIRGFDLTARRQEGESLKLVRSSGGGAIRYALVERPRTLAVADRTGLFQHPGPSSF